MKIVVQSSTQEPGRDAQPGSEETQAEGTTVAVAPDAAADPAEVAELPAPMETVFFSGPGDWKAVALVFDDGPHATRTPMVLDVLAAHHGARASFAVLGERLERHAEIVRATLEAGHQLVSHGWSHRIMTSLSDEDLWAELETTRTKLLEMGAGKVWWVRPPTAPSTSALPPSSSPPVPTR